ncbi:hypothetical protein Tco_0803136 [Tanacetum coccineum]|uniref:Uncharacterized protein n=1 Tax=Tanacetum coccineum TaxID=301880 RepID=A0ABQ5A530_9ASTR
MEMKGEDLSLDIQIKFGRSNLKHQEEEEGDSVDAAVVVKNESLHDAGTLQGLIVLGDVHSGNLGGLVYPVIELGNRASSLVDRAMPFPLSTLLEGGVGVNWGGPELNIIVDVLSNVSSGDHEVPPQTHIPLRPNLGVLQIGIKSQGYREPDFIMSDSEDSTVTYTPVSSPFEGLSDIGSPGVDGPPMMLEDPYAYVVAAFQAPSSPDYVHGPEELEQSPLSPEFVPELVYPEFIPPEDEVFPDEEQPLPAVILSTTDSPGYIVDSDPEEDEEDPKEDPEKDPEEDPTNYPADGGDDDDGDDESSDDDKDDDDDVEEEEEEHPAPADSIPPPVHRVTTRISIRAQTLVSLPSDIEVAILLAIPTPPPSPLSRWSSPLPQIPSLPLPPILSPLPQILSPPLPVSSLPLPASPTYPLGYRAAMIRLRAETPSTSHPLPSSTPPSGTPPLLPIPLPTLSLPLLLPSTICRAGVSEVTLSPRKRLCIALGPRYEVGKSSSAPTARPTGGFRADYGFVATLDDEIRSLMSGRLNMLFRDRRAHARTALLMEREARLSQIAALRAADRARQTQLVETLRLMSTLQTQVTALQGQQGPASGPTQPEIPEEAGSSS